MAKDVPEQGSFSAKDYHDPPPAPLIDPVELTQWSFYRALIAEFIATLLFLYITILTVIGYKSQTDPHKIGADACGGVGVLGIAWSFGGMIFVLVYCTAGISGGHINPAVTFGLLLARKVSLVRAVMYMVAQCLGAICGVGLVKAFQSSYYDKYGGGANSLAQGYTKGVGLSAEIVGTFVLVYTVFSATDPKRNARDSHVPVLAPLPIGFAVFMVHLATIPITGTGINPARSLGAAVIYNNEKAWDDHVLPSNEIMEPITVRSQQRHDLLPSVQLPCWIGLPFPFVRHGHYTKMCPHGPKTSSSKLCFLGKPSSSSSEDKLAIALSQQGAHVHF